jgi:hypothetical protein
MPQTFMDLVPIIGVLIALGTFWITYRSAKNRREGQKGAEQTMTNTHGGKQTATSDTVKQTMDNVVDGEQNG